MPFPRNVIRFGNNKRKITLFPLIVGVAEYTPRKVAVINIVDISDIFVINRNQNGFIRGRRGPAAQEIVRFVQQIKFGSKNCINCVGQFYQHK